MAELSEDVIRDVALLWECRRVINEATAQSKELRDRILKALGGDEIGLTASGVTAVEAVVQTRTGVDSHRLRAMHPQIWEQCRKQYEVTLLKLPLGSKAQELVIVPDEDAEEALLEKLRQAVGENP